MDPKVKLLIAATVFALLCVTPVAAGCVIGCKTCNGDSCTECGTGYYLDNNNCLSCGQMCATCNKDGCSACMPNYYMTPAKQCGPCNVGCTTCNNNFDCTSCVQGFTLNRNQAALANETVTGSCVPTKNTKSSEWSWWYLLIMIPLIIILIVLECMCPSRHRTYSSRRYSRGPNLFDLIL